MDSWWIDEAPYPGPDRPWTREEFLVHFAGVAARASSLAAEEMKKLGVSINKAGEQLARLDLILWPPPAVDEYQYWSEQQKRDHALRFRQNRSTGPRTAWTFNRNGKRVI